MGAWVGAAADCVVVDADEHAPSAAMQQTRADQKRLTIAPWEK
jgi:hypothetical protein